MKKHILCIDDEIHNLEALERLLRKDYSVSTATSGAKGLELVQKLNFALIISDQKMPEMTGVDFFAQAKLLQPDAVRILLTGYTDLESVIGAINQGQIYRYITKPWDPEELMTIVAQAIEVFGMRQTIAEQNLQLRKVNEELLSLDRLKTEFMLLVNHELKTPLTAITSFAQLLKEENLTPEQELYLQKILKNTRRLEDLIEDTLLITRLKTNLPDHKPEMIDIVDRIQKQWMSLNNEFKAKKMKLKLKNSTPFIQPTQSKYIDIIIKKLLHNGLVHSLPESTVQLDWAEDDHSWTLRCSSCPSQKITVSSQELLKPFRTTENIMNHSKGSGLGLAVIQTILNLFGGSIDLQIEPNQFTAALSFPKPKL